MIIIVHQQNKTIKVLNENKENVDVALGISVNKTLIHIAQRYPNELILWCHESVLKDINFKELAHIFHHKRILASFNPSNTSFLPNQIGYVERSFFLKVNKNVSFPTWIMSSVVGGMYAEVINNLKNEIHVNDSIDYVLNSIAKRGMAEGLFCYSEPKLLSKCIPSKVVTKQASTFQLFKFVKQHYKWVWVLFLWASYLIFEKKLMLLPLLYSLFYRTLKSNFSLEKVTIQSTKNVLEKQEVDVIIPTIGRKQYLYDVLKDFAKQSLKPKNVIIVEQNPLENSSTELDYLKNEEWPFNVKHIFTNKTGVCNARNLGLEQVESEWIFLGDDDNRFDETLLEHLFKNIVTHGATVGTTVYLQPNETQTYLKTAQTSIFGAGNSIVKSSALKHVKFNTKYEFNYGEDTDFGMQLRHQGHDVIYFADIRITHLKAPIGGYRTKVKQLWADDEVQPKPSPTIQMLYKTYYINHQQSGYKLLLGLRSYKHSKIKNPIKYIKSYTKQWKHSEYWCSKLLAN